MMDARTYLEEFSLLRKQLKLKADALESDRLIYTRFISGEPGVNVQTQRNIRAYEDQILLLMDREKELENERIAYLKSLNKVSDLLDHVKPAEAGLLLKLRYLQELNWDKISSHLNFSRSHLFRLHKQGIAHLDRLLKDETE